MWTPANRGRMANIAKKTKRYPSDLTDEEWERIAFNTSRRSTSGLRPFLAGCGKNGAIRSHSSSVRSDGYRFVFFAISAIRPRFAGVHIPSLNHAKSFNTIHSQTVSKRTNRLLPSLSAFGPKRTKMGFGPRWYVR